MAFYLISDGTTEVPVWFDDEADFVAALQANFAAVIFEQDRTTPNRADIALGTEQFHFARDEAWPSSNWLGAYDTVSGSDAWWANEDGAALPANFSGTATLTFGQSGNLFGPSEFSGSTPIIFGQTGNLLSSTSLSGTASLTFGQSGAIQAPSAFAGTTPITFGQSGDFGAATSGAGATFSGSTSITFGQSGTLASATSFAGSAPIAFGQSGAIGAASILVGTAQVIFGQSGNLFGPATMQGNAPIVFGQSGDFSAAVGNVGANFSGTATISFGQSATFVAANDNAQHPRANDVDGGDTGWSRSTSKSLHWKFKDYLDRPKPEKRKRKKRVQELLEAFVPIAINFTDDDQKEIKSALNQAETSSSNWDSSIELILQVVIEVMSRKRRERNRRIALAMLLAA